MTTNSFGTPVTALVCSACGRAFTVCPVVSQHEWGSECLAVDCPSYDPARDIDKDWDDAAISGQIARESKSGGVTG